MYERKYLRKGNKYTTIDNKYITVTTLSLVYMLAILLFVMFGHRSLFR